MTIAEWLRNIIKNLLISLQKLIFSTELDLWETTRSAACMKRSCTNCGLVCVSEAVKHDVKLLVTKGTYILYNKM